MTCILCGEKLQQKLPFHHLFLLKPEDAAICSSCKESFELISEQHCPKCWKSGKATICKDCQYWKEQGQEVSHHALFCYNDAMKSYFSRYKFEGDYLLRKVFARELKEAFKKYKGYTIVTLPVSKERYHERGFNQVTGLLEAAGVPYTELLEKSDTSTQSSKSRLDRLKTKQSFSLKSNVKLAEKILLGDDIYTTGATLQLAKALFYENGVKEVVTLSLAR